MSNSLQQRVAEALDPAPDWTRGQVLLWRPFPAAPVSYFVRFLGEQACKVNAQGTYEPALIEAVLNELSPGDLGFADTGALISFRPCRALEQTGFDMLAIVNPTMSRGALSKTTDFMAPVTFTAFPAYRCEFTANDTQDELAFRLAKVVRWSDWSRQPAPAISARFHRLKSGAKSTGGKRMGVFPWIEIERTLGFLAKEDGFLEMVNFERRQARLEHAGGRFTVESGGEPWHADPEAAIRWVKAYVTKGVDAANQSR